MAPVPDGDVFIHAGQRSGVTGYACEMQPVAVAVTQLQWSVLFRWVCACVCAWVRRGLLQHWDQKGNQTVQQVARQAAARTQDRHRRKS